MKKATKLLYEIFQKKARLLDKRLLLSMAVALSGGPDSMALSFVSSLYFQAQSTSTSLLSTQEGEYVHSQIRCGF